MSAQSQRRDPVPRLIFRVALRILSFLFVVALAFGEPDRAAVAHRLADRAKLARDAGDVVRAYVLYNEAAKRDPSNESYAKERDSLAQAANLLMRTQLEAPVLAADIAAVEKEEADAEAAANPPPVGLAELHQSLASFPHVEPKQVVRDFDLRGDEISLLQQVTAAYGVRASWDPQLDSKSGVQFRITQADFRTAMEALTLATNTFVFPISTNTLYFARDSDAKRSELEPVILLSIPLPDAMNEKDLVDVANGVRGALNLRQFGWDSLNRTVFIRDRVSRALAARAMLESVLLPKPQVEFDVQVVTFDFSTSYTWGISPPTTVSFFSLNKFNLNNLLTNGIGGFTQLFAMGSGLGLVGMGIGNANLFAAYTKSVGTTNYDATVVTLDGQAASAHYGEQYPVAQMLYGGGVQSTAGVAIAPQVEQENLGLQLKLTPHIKGGGEVAVDVEATYASLGTVVLNSVPSIAERKYSGNVTLREGQCAVIAGLDQDELDRSRSGLAGLNNVTGLNQVLSENQRTKTKSNTLILITPYVIRTPISATLATQYFLGPQHGFKVLL